MDDVAVGTIAEEESMEENGGEEDIQANTPLQGSTTGDVDPKLQQPTGTNGNLRTPMATYNSNLWIDLR